jgi:hypothetical protein
MKQKDIATIVFIIGLSAIVSVVVSNLLISSPKNRQQKVEIVDPVGAEFVRPDEKIFNDKAINPTQTVQIGNESNQKPFSSTQ